MRSPGLRAGHDPDSRLPACHEAAGEDEQVVDWT